MQDKDRRPYSIWGIRENWNIPLGSARTFWGARWKARRWLKKGTWFTSTLQTVEIRERGRWIWHQVKGGPETFRA